MERFKDLVQPADKSYPDSMRRQLWPLCCGASILSGFKAAHKSTHEELVAQINNTINDYIPDLQVYVGEAINPKLVFLTLNQSQMSSGKIMKAVEETGFIKFAEAKPRGSAQGFFFKDMSQTFTLVLNEDGGH